MALTDAVRDEVRKLRDEVLTAVGPTPPLPSADDELPPPVRVMSPRQRVADALQPLLPSDTTLGKVDLWKGGGALEGLASNEAAVREFVRRLDSSGEVRDPMVAVIRPESARVAYRILVTFMCSAPGEPSMCPPSRGRYTRKEFEDALTPVLGQNVVLTQFALRDDSTLDLGGRATADEVNALIERIRTQLPWMQLSASSVANGEFNARLHILCKAPPRDGGICVLPKASH
jgi:hypothetical protein